MVSWSAGFEVGFAMACPVCFGGDDLGVRESLNAGIGVLLAVTAVVLGAFARLISRIARLSKEHARADNETLQTSPYHSPQDGGL